MDPMEGTLPETNSSPLKIGRGTRKETQFSGAFGVSFAKGSSYVSPTDKIIY